MNQRSGIKLEIRNNGIDQAIQHGSAPDKLKAFAAIKEVVKNGFVVYNGENPKNNKGKLVVISKHVDIASKQYVVTAGFREDANGRLFYDHEMLDIRRVEGLLSQSSEGQMPRHPAPASPRLNDYYTKFINQNIDYSKVVDSNGEPLVVYHGTDADIEKFATEKAGDNGIGAGLGSFFTDNSTYASEYAEKLGGNVIVNCRHKVTIMLISSSIFCFLL